MKKLAAAATIAALTALTLALGGCTEANGPATPKVNAFETQILHSDVAPGDCIAAVWEVSFKTVPCDEEHSDEVYSVVSFTTGSFKSDTAEIADAYFAPVSYQSYLGGELPTVVDADGIAAPTTWSVSAFSFSGRQTLWDAGFKKAIFTVRTDKLGKQVGSVKDILAGTAG
jgi:hypothetical protein